MADSKESSKQFEPYTVGYVSDLLKVVKCDVQDNTTISENGYLEVALEACQKFNNTFVGKTFDKGE